jgi:carboxylate-amine ligase
MEYKPDVRGAARIGAEPSFRIGIEEEHFVCDAVTLQAVMRTPDSLFKNHHGQTGGSVGREMLQAQLELVTQPHLSLHHAAEELKELRNKAAEAAASHGLKILASGTHPTANWRESVHSPKERYRELMRELQILARRDMLCGMHVHVELPDPGSRVNVMTRMLPYVPLFLALSTSSPFWQSEYTGLKGYRLAAYDELPRTGLPELFWSAEEYEAYVAALVSASAIPDASHVWWAMRPSHAFPTLELRAADSCTHVDDAIAIAALFRALARHLFRHPGRNADLDVVDRAIAIENKWRAQRDGVEASFVTRTGALSASEMLDRLIEQIADDTDALGCVEEAERCRTIVRNGTSADAQVRIFFQDDQRDVSARFKLVLSWIAEQTLLG